MAYVLTDNDRQNIKAYQTAYNQAKAAGDSAGMAAAHAGAEAVRAGYNYSGGIDGSQYIPLGNSGANTGLTATAAYGGSVPAVSAQRGSNPYESYLNTVREQQAQAVNAYNQMLGYSQSAYADMLKNAVAANNAAAQQQVSRLNSQKGDVDNTYTDNARQAYVAYMQGQRAMPQLMAASGQTGGATETANLGLLTNYNNNVGNINNERARAIKAIDDSINDAIWQAEQANAQAAQANAGNALNSYLSILGNAANTWDSYNSMYGNAYGRYVDQENYLNDYQRQLEQQAYNRQMQAAELAYERELAAQQRGQALLDQNYERAMQRLKLGMATADDLLALGLTENAYNTFLTENFGRDINGNYIMPVSTGGGSSGGGRSSGRSGGGSSGGGSSSSLAGLAWGTDAFNQSIYDAAAAAGQTGRMYLLQNKKNLGMTESQLSAALSAYDAWESGMNGGATAEAPRRRSAANTAGASYGLWPISNAGAQAGTLVNLTRATGLASNLANAANAARTGNTAKAEKAIDNLYYNGLIDEDTAVKLQEKYVIGK